MKGVAVLVGLCLFAGLFVWRWDCPAPEGSGLAKIQIWAILDGRHPRCSGHPLAGVILSALRGGPTAKSPTPLATIPSQPFPSPLPSAPTANLVADLQDQHELSATFAEDVQNLQNTVSRALAMKDLKAATRLISTSFPRELLAVERDAPTTLTAAEAAHPRTVFGRMTNEAYRQWVVAQTNAAERALNRKTTNPWVTVATWGKGNNAAGAELKKRFDTAWGHLDSSEQAAVQNLSAGPGR